MELIITYFVALLVLSILWQIFLHGIIGEMDGSETIFGGILVRCGPNVPQFIPIAFDNPIY